MENYDIRLQNAKRAIKNADVVLIGAGAGLSTAAGLEYSDKNKDYPFASEEINTRTISFNEEMNEVVDGIS